LLALEASAQRLELLEHKNPSPTLHVLCQWPTRSCERSALHAGFPVHRVRSIADFVAANTQE